MVLEKEILVITLIVFSCSFRVEADCGSLLLDLTETVVVRGNVLSFDFPFRCNFENDLFDSLSLIFIFHVDFNVYWLVLIPLLFQLLLYWDRKMVLTASFLVLLFKRNLKIVLLVEVDVTDFTLVNHVFNNSAIFLHKQFVLVYILDLLENFFQTLGKHVVLCLQIVLSDLIGLRFLCF